MNVTATDVPGVLVLEPRVFTDSRGSFVEVFRADAYATFGARAPFVQDNVSTSRAGVVRGLHFQHPRGQAKLIHVVRGEIFDVAVDVRHGSPTFGHAAWGTLSASNQRQMFVPAGFAHGFLVTSDEAVVFYKCSDYYAPEREHSLRWNDPALRIPWPVATTIVSAKDGAAPLLADLPREWLPRFEP